MDLGLHDKVVIITAASRGLGKATALQFAREGARVVVNARDAQRLAAVAAECEALSGKPALAVPGDVTHQADVERIVRETLDRFGRIDVLVTNAGGPPAGLFGGLGLEQWEAAYQLTLLSAVRLIQAVVPSMQAQRSGSIVSINSVTVKQPIPGLTLSNTIRDALHGLVKTLSQELAADGIRVNSVLPGWTRTERVDEILAFRAADSGRPEAEIQADITGDIPLGRMGRPEEFANAVVFIASPAAGYITGVALQVDGGMVRGKL